VSDETFERAMDIGVVITGGSAGLATVALLLAGHWTDPLEVAWCLLMAIALLYLAIHSAWQLR
jgi:hypothetical protein